MVRTWQVRRRLLSPALDLPESFRAPRSLYFFHPGGRRLRLCEAPEREARLTRWPEHDSAVDVTLHQP
ncbi:hypothetical protein [Melittangium boletus]|uniref:Uncharacterized protein n=1 Tax=Melittangium boletus DSM 14713 TaxID=1294270 RepID=A0A250I8S8_9BACT|nr:hypothetical protein [Melittangium boletus]ATB27608.1 hypothetical protein MEBOL_001052 [Melittangium boletus DSM 14713]